MPVSQKNQKRSGVGIMEGVATYPRKKKREFPLGRAFLSGAVLILLTALAVLGYFFYNTHQELQFLQSTVGQVAVADQEVSAVVEELSEFVVLPDERPVVATITGAEVLAEQSNFYRNAMNGDKLVIFAESQQVYIYRPSRDVVVNVGPLYLDLVPEGAQLFDGSESTTPSAETQ